jgi:hypothetical protein
MQLRLWLGPPGLFLAEDAIMAGSEVPAGVVFGSQPRIVGYGSNSSERATAPSTIELFTPTHPTPFPPIRDFEESVSADVSHIGP